MNRFLPCATALFFLPFLCLQAQEPDAATAYGSPAPAATQTGAPQQGAATVVGGALDTGLPIDLPVTTDARLLYPVASKALIQTGDLITIFIYGETSFSPPVRVDADGNIDVPFLHTIHVAGLNSAQAQDYIAGLLRDAKVFTEPQVIVTITGGVGFDADIFGEVRGHVPIYGSRTLLQVLAAVGGLSATSGHTILISRRGVPNPIVVDLGSNPVTSPGGQTIILPGDVINVGPAGFVYVLGQFKSTGIYPLSGSQPTDLLEFAAKLGDPNFAAKPRELRLIRTTNGQRHFVTLDYKAIVEGKAPSPILQAGDILYMPTNAFKAAITSGGLAAGVNIVNLALLAFEITRY